MELAIFEVSKKNRRGGEDDEEGGDVNESKVVVKRQTTTKKGHLGTNLLIKLPYIIGTPEYQSHPFAGVVFASTNDEQEELFKEEI